MILISACLAGINCKYNGENNGNEKVMELIKNEKTILVCPEQLGGLKTPRIPAEIKIINGEKRIKYKHLSENKQIAGNTNEALKLVTGEFVALLDHDDILPRFSLFEVVKAINENIEAEFFYSDEDKLMEYKEKRMGPHFKSDFAIDTLRSYNYICHLSVFKKEK